MTFWSTQDFENCLQDIVPDGVEREHLLRDISPKTGKCNRIRESSLELSLGDEVFISSEKKLKALKEQHGMVRIAPGDLALLITKEWIEIPPDCMGFIAMKSKYKLSGLINISGFHVDPGFKGRLKFSVYNAGSGDVVLKHGQATFIVFITFVRAGVDLQGGEHWHQKHIEPKDMMPLLGAGIPVHDLAHRLGNVETMVKLYGGVLIGIFLVLLTWLLSKLH